MGFFQGTQERVRNSRSKRAISVRAIEVLLFKHRCNIYISISMYANKEYSKGSASLAAPWVSSQTKQTMARKNSSSSKQY